MKRATIRTLLFVSACTNALLATLVCLSAIILSSPMPFAAVAFLTSGLFLYVLAIVCAMASESAALS